jgi:hypothetical protein
MSGKFKDKSSDNLVKNGIDIINELSERGVNLFQKTINTYQHMKGLSQKAVSIVHTIKRNKGNDQSNCKHRRIRFITESVKKIPEGYTKMQKRADVDLEKDYSTIGHYINKHTCDECGKLLFSDEL